MPRTAQTLHPDIPLSNAALRAIAMQALFKSPLRRIRTSRPMMDGAFGDAPRPAASPERDQSEACNQRERGLREGGPDRNTAADGVGDLGPASNVAALPTPPVSSFATVREALARDEDAIANVVLDAALAYLELAPEARPEYPRQWFRIVMERLARREAHRHAWHIGMLLPPEPSSENADEGKECGEDFASDDPTPEAEVIAEELRREVEAIWGTTPDDRRLLAAVLTGSVRELAEAIGEKPDTLHRRATTRRVRLRRELPARGHDLLP